MKKTALSIILLTLVLVMTAMLAACNAPTGTTATTPNTPDGPATPGNPNAAATVIQDGMTYTLSSSRTYYSLTSVGDNTAADITVPAKIDGVPVEIIYNEAFKNCKTLKNITLPDSITAIGTSAFEGCSSLRAVNIGKESALTKIYPSAFCGCANLTSFTVTSKVEEIGVSAFLDCYKLIEVIDLSSKLYIEADSTSNGHISSNAMSVLTSSSAKSEIIKQDDFLFFVYSYLEKQDDGSKIMITDRYLLSYVGNDSEITLPEKLVISDTEKYDYMLYKYAFYYNTDLEKVTVPASVISMGKHPFLGCTSLVEMTVPYVGDNSGNFHFGYLFGALVSNKNGEYVPQSLKTVNVTTTNRVGFRGFYDCTGITTINLSDSVTSIGTDVFRGCTGLTQLTLPQGLVAIESQAFRDCTNLLSMTIPAGVTEIAPYLFRGCTSLTTVTLPDVITSIGTEAFYGCSQLQPFALSNSIVAMGSDVFTGCTNILTTENGVSYVGKWAVGFDKEMATVTLRNDTIGISESLFKDAVKITSVSLPDSVIYVGPSVFHGCTLLTTVDLPDQLNKIPSYTFYGCTSLSTIVFPESITAIESYAFYGCSNLQNITITANIKLIENYVFAECKKLASVTFENTSNWVLTETKDVTTGEALDVSNASNNAKNLKKADSKFDPNDYQRYYWQVVIPQAN